MQSCYRRSRDPALTRIGNLVAEIRSNPWKAYHFKQIAKDHGMSYSHFRLRFRQLAGTGPDAFMLHRRMHSAALQLHNPHKSISQLANELGYENPAYFSRLFKSKIGVSPKAYRDALPLR